MDFLGDIFKGADGKKHSHSHPHDHEHDHDHPHSHDHGSTHDHEPAVRKIVCSNCNGSIKMKEGFKFCPYCGTEMTSPLPLS